jgi:hypothetical protein
VCVRRTRAEPTGEHANHRRGVHAAVGWRSGRGRAPRDGCAVRIQSSSHLPPQTWRGMAGGSRRAPRSHRGAAGIGTGTAHGGETRPPQTDLRCRVCLCVVRRPVHGVSRGVRRRLARRDARSRALAARVGSRRLVPRPAVHRIYRAHVGCSAHARSAMRATGAARMHRTHVCGARCGGRRRGVCRLRFVRGADGTSGSPEFSPT